MEDLKSGQSYFKELTGIRAIAAYMVFFHHFNIFEKNSWLHNFCGEFYIGVTVFFVLSGFLISYRYFDVKRISVSKYLLNRFARIYPVYFIITLLTFYFFDFYEGSFFYTRLLLSLTMLRGFFDYYKFTGVEQGWSLTVEETFYFLAPIILFLVSKRKVFLVLLPILFVCFGLFLVQIFSRYSMSGFFVSREFMFNYTFFGRCCEFFSGIIMTFILRKNIRFPFAGCTSFGLLFIFISIFLLVGFKGDNDYGIQSDYGKVVNTLLLPVFGIVPFFYGLINEKTIISKLLSTNLFQMLGKSSYVFYLIHMGFLEKSIRGFLPDLGVISIIVSFIILIILSIIIFLYVENPLNNFLRRLSSQPKN
jgi:peptidoglycan/LPS O-acetylase OafA/YrhL